jgi:hypothetical protein
MQKALVVIIITLISSFAYSQDKILTHRGDSIMCKVTEILENSIKYKYQGEDIMNSISKNIVSEIIFSNGRVQKISDKIIINSELDWEKVIITSNNSDVDDLKRVGEMMAKASSGWSTTNQGKMEKLAMDKLKKEAAIQGCHIVLLLTTTGKGGHAGMSGGAKASVTGVGYKY